MRDSEASLEWLGVYVEMEVSVLNKPVWREVEEEL